MIARASTRCTPVVESIFDDAAGTNAALTTSWWFVPGMASIPTGWPARATSPLTRRPLHLAHQQPLSVDGTRHDVELRGITVPVTLRRLPGTQPRQRRVDQMEHRHRHPAQLLPRIRLQTRPVAVPVGQPRVARCFRQDRPVRSLRHGTTISGTDRRSGRDCASPTPDCSRTGSRGARSPSPQASPAAATGWRLAGRLGRAISLMRCPAGADHVQYRT